MKSFHLTSKDCCRKFSFNNVEFMHALGIKKTVPQPGGNMLLNIYT